MFSLSFKGGGGSAEIDDVSRSCYFLFYLHRLRSLKSKEVGDFISTRWRNLLAAASQWKTSYYSDQEANWNRFSLEELQSYSLKAMFSVTV